MVVVSVPFTYLACALTAVLKTEKNGADNLLASHGLSKIYEFLLSRGHDTYLKELPEGLELFKYACSLHTQLDILIPQLSACHDSLLCHLSSLQLAASWCEQPQTHTMQTPCRADQFTSEFAITACNSVWSSCSLFSSST